MGKHTGKTVKSEALPKAQDATQVGPELRRLRLLAGLTQRQIAARLDVRQATILRIEQGGEIYLSTVQRYVKALGASLRLDARFPTDAPLSTHLDGVFDVKRGGDSQLTLPVLDDEFFKPQRDVVLSIKPIYSEEILTGRKTVELRRRFPVSAPSGSWAYIYSTSPVKAMVGRASIREVLKLPVKQIWTEFQNKASIEKPLFDKYFEGLDDGYALMFDKVKSFSRPWPLRELREKFGFEPPRSFVYAKYNLRKALQDETASVSH